jgi:hypothetical protein
MYVILTNVLTCHCKEIVVHSSENYKITFSLVTFFIFAIVLIISYASVFHLSLHTSFAAFNFIPFLHIISFSPIFSAPPADFVQVGLSSYIDV